MSLEQFQLFEELWVDEFYLIVQNFRIDSKNLETLGVVESVNASPFLRLVPDPPELGLKQPAHAWKPQLKNPLLRSLLSSV